MPIYVDTDNSDPKHKIFSAGAAGASAKPAEDLMQKMVKEIIDKSPEFTTAKTDKAKGYAIMLTLTSVQGDNRNAKCSMRTEIVEYPRKVTAKGDTGDIAVSLPATNSVEVNGMRDPIMVCVDALVSSMVPKAIPHMSRHFATRR